VDVKNIIKNRRLELGLTMKEVADACGVSEGAVSRWESGEVNNMRRDRIYALSQVLQISPLLILGIEPKENDRVNKNVDQFIELLEPLTEEEQERLLNIMKMIINERK